MVLQVVLAVLVAVVLWWAVRHRRPRRVRIPQRRAHVSAAGELRSLEERPR